MLSTLGNSKRATLSTEPTTLPLPLVPAVTVPQDDEAMLHGERACKRTRTPCKAQDILVELHRLSESVLLIEPVPSTMMATLYGSTAAPEPLAEAVAVAVRVVVALPPKSPPKRMGTVNLLLHLDGVGVGRSDAGDPQVDEGGEALQLGVAGRHGHTGQIGVAVIISGLLSCILPRWLPQWRWAVPAHRPARPHWRQPGARVAEYRYCQC